ncbi:MAG: hypothetical protein HQK89_16735 [Nitrospirae bacterium]|nr:hypothetical protein [Nitrospirota bacterium]
MGEDHEKESTPSIKWLKLKISLFSTKGLIFAGVFLAVGIVLTRYFPESSTYFIFYLLGLFFTELGFAVLIAVIIGITLDQVHKGEFMERAENMLKAFRDSSFHALFKVFIPKEYLEELRQQIFTKSYIKPSVDVYFVLRKISDEVVGELRDLHENLDTTDRIYVELTIEQVVKNIGGAPLTYQAAFGIEKEDAPLFNTAIKASIQEAGKPSTVFNKNALEDYHCKGDDVNNVYKLDAVTIEPDQEITVVALFRSIRSAKNNREVWSTLSLAKRVKIYVRDMTKSLNLKCIALARGEAKESIANTDEYEYRWDIKTPLLPYQGFTLSWNKKREVP